MNYISLLCQEIDFHNCSCLVSYCLSQEIFQTDSNMNCGFSSSVILLLLREESTRLSKQFSFCKMWMLTRRTSHRRLCKKQAFFAHPDQILLAMVAVKDDTVRRKALSMIRKLRQDEADCGGDKTWDRGSRGGVKRDCWWPRASDEEEDNSDRNENDGISFIWTGISEKFMFQVWSGRPKVITLWSTGKNLSLKLLSSPSVEKGVKVVTESCLNVTGYKERDGFLRQRLQSRREIPRFNVKKDYCFNN